jgi:hypothetical protein
MRGLYHAWRKTEDFNEYAMVGGAFSGAYHSRDVFKGSLKAIEKAKKRLKGKSKIRKGLDIWERVGEASENAARMGLYLKLKKRGKSTFEAAYEAKDLLDFHKSGKMGAVRVAIQMIPFLNARLQGISKLGRTAFNKKTATQFWLKAMMLAAASLALAWDNEDDERYKALPDYEKRMYWHTWIADQHIKIPVPFEIGSIFGTLPTAFREYVIGERTGKELAEFAGQIGEDMFAFNPVPQFGKPIVEIATNVDAFTGAPIVPTGQEKLSKFKQASPTTSKTLQAAAKLSEDVLGVSFSPKQAEHLLKGYFAYGAQLTLAGLDLATEHMSSLPEDPAEVKTDKWLGILGIKRFWDREAIPRKYDRNAERFYNMLGELDTLYADYNDAKRVHDKAEMVRLRKRHGKRKISVSKKAQKIRRKISKINARIRMIRLSKSKTPAMKRNEIDQQLDNRKRVIERFLKKTWRAE